MTLIVRVYARRHAGIWSLEARFWDIWPSDLMSMAGLVCYGQTLEAQVSWIGLAFG